MNIFARRLDRATSAPRPCSQPWMKTSLNVETLESRNLMTADPLPVLMVIADQRDFYYQEYGDTRNAIESRGIDVAVAATTTLPSTAHANTGQIQANVSGIVTPDIALANVNADDYSAIVFVGGWGASMYQYAYNDPNGDGVTDNFYWHGAYNGDDNLGDGVIAPQKVVVNRLIGDFLQADKPVAAVCHGVTVLAWARVDGVSPLAGKHVAAPLTVGSPNQHYAGGERVYPYFSGQYDQVVANGGLAGTVSGAIGNPNTAADDVIVDGRIITGENYDSAAHFGNVIANEVLANVVAETPPVRLVGNNLEIHGGDGNDAIVVWSNALASSVSATVNGVGYGPFAVGAGGRVIVFGGGGDDRIDATGLRIAAEIMGEAGHDLIVGGAANDRLDGGDGRDILIGGLGSDSVKGGSGDDILIGGTTSYDTNTAVLDAIWSAWRNPGSLAERMTVLTAPTFAGRLALGSTVHDDGVKDALFGGDGADWLFALPGDSLPAFQKIDRRAK